MLIFSDGTLPEPLRLECGDYTWDVGTEDFKCEIRGLSHEWIQAVSAIVKRHILVAGVRVGTPHISTSNPDEPYSCDITITCEINNTGDALDVTYKFPRFNWETWDDEDGTIKLKGRYRGPYKETCWACQAKIRAGDVICSTEKCGDDYRRGYDPYDKR